MRQLILSNALLLRNVVLEERDIDQCVIVFQEMKFPIRVIPAYNYVAIGVT